MIATDNLTKLTFTIIPSIMPSAWYLGDFIPGGVLDASHIQVRIRPLGKYWQSWGPVDGWDPVTKEATFFRPLALRSIEFRRITPRARPWRDPLVPTSRVSKKHLQVNADQGVFVATEWAADYGIDARLPTLNEPGDGPNTLGLVQRTQNHWGSGADYTRKVWNFQFSGGYITRAHVKAQVKLASGWQTISIDPSENDPDAPSNAPFRFIGDYQLYLDLATLGEPVLGLIIYRHTPRTVSVSSPDDAAIVTGPNMEPSARHAFFVAVEIGEELAKRSQICECPGRYYTSGLYPVLATETMRAFKPAVLLGKTIGLQTDTMVTTKPTMLYGTLTSTIINYTNSRDVAPESMVTAKPTVLSGTLAVIIINYTNSRDVAPESMVALKPTIQSGTLNVIIINYTNSRDVAPETMNNPKPTILSGTLT